MIFNSLTVLYKIGNVNRRQTTYITQHNKYFKKAFAYSYYTTKEFRKANFLKVLEKI